MSKKIISSALLVSLLAAGLAAAYPERLSSWYEALFRQSQEQLIDSARQQEEAQFSWAENRKAEWTETVLDAMDEEADKNSRMIRERMKQKTETYEAKLKRAIEGQSLKYEEELEHYLAVKLQETEAELDEEMKLLMQTLMNNE